MNGMEAIPFGERLRLIRRGELVRAGPAISLRELARCSGINHATLSEAENGKGWVGKLPSLEDLEALARCLDVTLPELVGRPIVGMPVPEPPAEEPLDALLRRIGAEPVYEYPVELEQVGSAGPGAGVIQGEEEPPRRRRREPTRYLLRVEGDCLTPEVEPGDRVEFEPDAAYEPGDLVVAVQDGETVLIKHYDEVDDVQYLLPINGHPLRIGPGLRIIGVVKEIHRQPKRRRMGRR